MIPDTIQFKSIIALNSISNSIYSELESSNISKVFNTQLALLEIFNYELRKLERIGYCDYELAYLVYHLASLFRIKPERLTNATSVIHQSISETLAAKIPKFVVVKSKLKSTTASIPSADPLVSRLNSLKSAGSATNSDNVDVFKYREAVSPVELNKLLSSKESKILLIDYRETKDFDNNHINYLEVVHIEPSHIDLIHVDKDITDQDLESRLQLHLPKEEYIRFQNRYKYDLVIIYNLRFGPKGKDTDRFESLKEMLMNGDDSILPSKNPFRRLVELITFNNKYLSSKLKRHPCYLAGGVYNWFEVFGEQALKKTITPQVLTKPSASFGGRNGSVAPPSYEQASKDSSPYLKNFSEYLSKAQSTVNTPSSNAFSSSWTYTPEPAQIMPPSQQASKEQKRNSITSSTKVITTKVPDSNGVSDPSNFIQVCTTGLVNLGNSCYMNCVLQCLSATPQLTKFFFPNLGTSNSSASYRQHINVNNILGTKGILTTNFVQLLLNIFNSNGKSFSPKSFKQVIGSLSPGGQFASFDQQDCIEFLNFLLDVLHEDLNQMIVLDSKQRQAVVELTPEQEKAREFLPIRLASTIEWERYLKLNFSVIVDYFQGQYASHLKCLECGLSSTTYNAFSILSLPIPNKSSSQVLLEDCLKEFTTTELLDKDNKWHCPNCKKFTNLTKKISITRLPQILIINFKRFGMTPSGYFSKLDKFVSYPVNDTLDLTKYWPVVGSYLNKGEDMSIEKEEQYLSTLPTRNQIPPFRYKLYGVVNHFGNLTTGHYTSYVHKSNDSKKTRGWCYFDDAKVTFNCPVSQVLNKNAYCLFYQRV